MGEVEQLKDDLGHLDAVIKLFKADYQTTSLKPIKPYKPNPDFLRGALLRMAFDILRAAEEPISTREVARRILEQEGNAMPTNEELQRAIKGISTLVKYEKIGAITTQRKNGVKLLSLPSEPYG
jgi:hypothetical protein